MSVLRFSFLLLALLFVQVSFDDLSWRVGIGEPASAQMQFGGQIGAIEVSGNQRFSNQVVITQMGVTTGDPFDPMLLNEAVKTLLASGNFEDVTLSRRGNTLIVTVVEVLFVNSVIFEGNDALNAESLEAIVGTQEAARLSRAQLQEDVNAILGAYGSQGRYQARVVPLVSNHGNGRVDVVFRIDEGQVTRVGSVNFVGNQAFSDGALRWVVSSKQYTTLRSITGGDRFSESALLADRQVLTAHYTERGFADFEVLSSQASLVSDQSGFVVTFAVSEGARYQFADRRIANEINGLDTDALNRVIGIRQGSLYKRSRVAAAIERVRSKAEDLGYGAAVVTVDFVRRPNEGEIDLILRVSQGPSISVERIEIEGNLRTRDYVIRREMRLSEGDAFSRNRLQRSLQRINQLGYFSSADIRTREGSSPDQAIVTVDVQERSTGNLNFGGGTGSDGGVKISFAYEERNFLGKGQQVGLTIDYGEETQSLNFSFTEPWFRGREVSAGGDVFFNRARSTDFAFDQDTRGVTARLGYALSDNWSQGWSYTYRETDVLNIRSASPAIVDQAGLTVRSSIRHSLRYNSIDSPIKPTDGLIFDMTNELTGTFLGGDVDTLKTTVRASYYRPLGETFVLRLKGEAGQISSRSSAPVPLVDRFNFGNDLVRGFNQAGITTRTSGGQVIGATTYYGATAELRFPFPGLGERGVDGRFFVDLGSAYDQGSDFTLDFGSGPTSVVDSNGLRSAYGVGFTWVSPIGPVNFDWGFPESSEDHDRLRRLSFGFGVQL